MGRAVADADVAHALLHKAKGFTHEDMKILQLEGEAKPVEYNRYFPPDTQAALFWLRNRRHKQWRQRIEHEHSATDDKLRELEEAGIRARNAPRTRRFSRCDRDAQHPRGGKRTRWRQPRATRLDRVHPVAGLPRRQSAERSAASSWREEAGSFRRSRPGRCGGALSDPSSGGAGEERRLGRSETTFAKLPYGDNPY
jgi:hypothetical protein